MYFYNLKLIAKKYPTLLYFDHQTGAPHPVCWSKLTFSRLSFVFLAKKKKKRKIDTKLMENMVKHTYKRGSLFRVNVPGCRREGLYGYK